MLCMEFWVRYNIISSSLSVITKNYYTHNEGRSLFHSYSKGTFIGAYVTHMKKHVIKKLNLAKKTKKPQRPLFKTAEKSRSSCNESVNGNVQRVKVSKFRVFSVRFFQYSYGTSRFAE